MVLRMDIIGFVNNPWFVGIAGGIFSGLITTWIGRKVFSGKDKKEYLQKVEATNKEIVYSLRSAISDAIHHDRKVILSLMAATARKNGVLLKDIYTIKEITEDLIKEVIDSSFIPSDYKKNFCETLSKIYLHAEPATEESSENYIYAKEQAAHLSRKNESIIASATTLLGVMVALLTFALSFIQSGSSALDTLREALFFGIGPAISKVFPVAFPAFIALVSMMILVIMKTVINKKEKTFFLSAEPQENKNSKTKNAKKESGDEKDSK